MLRQEINLYRPQFNAQQTEGFLTWHRLQMIIGGFTAFLFLIFLYSLISNYFLRSEVLNAQTQERRLQNKFAELKNHYPQLFFSKDVHESVNALQKELSAQENIIESITNHAPFSQYLIGLSRSITPNVWLTQIEIEKNGQLITLKGKSMGMDALHGFLNNLLKDKAFTGLMLNLSNIENNVSQNVNFEINLSKKT